MREQDLQSVSVVGIMTGHCTGSSEDGHLLLVVVVGQEMGLGNVVVHGCTIITAPCCRWL